MGDEWIRHEKSKGKQPNQKDNGFQPIQTSDIDYEDEQQSSVDSNDSTVSQAEEDDLKQLVLLHMQNSIENKLPVKVKPFNPDENSNGFLGDDYLVYNNDEDYLEPEFDALSQPQDENFNEGNVSDEGVRYISNTQVINKAGYPQVVIIPHSVSDSNQFTLSLGKHKIGFETKNGENAFTNAQDNDQQEIRGPKEQFSRLIQVPQSNNIDVNEKRRQALLRASEKQELLLLNLLDAIEQ